MKSYIAYGLLVVAIIAGLIFVRNNSEKTVESRMTIYDTFAQCLTDAGAKFYGAYWCPHCQEQKKLFQNSKLLPYIECSTPDGNGMTQICIDEKISGYPTWKFADGSVVDSVQSLKALSEKTGCELPTVTQ
jgi:thiol-disulfide isomerase/thioredoxin